MSSAKKTAELFPVTPQEYAYILLYLNSIAPGVGQGHKAAMAGKACNFETIAGKNLFETCLLNLCALMENSCETGGIPQWRWPSQYEGFVNVFEDEWDEVLPRLFFPVKIVSGKPDDGIIKECIYEKIDFKNVIPNGAKIFESLQESWKQMEPAAVIVHNTKKNEVYYDKPKSADLLWMSLLQAANMPKKSDIDEVLSAQGNKEQKTDNSAEKKTNQSPLITDSKTNIYLLQTNEENIHLCIYYRIADAKWVYESTGKLDGTFTKELFQSEQKQAVLQKMISLIQKAGDYSSFYVSNYMNAINGMSDTNKKGKEKVNYDAQKYIVKRRISDEAKNLTGIFTGSGALCKLMTCEDGKENDVFEEFQKDFVKRCVSALELIAISKYAFYMEEQKKKFWWALIEKDNEKTKTPEKIA